MRYVLVSHFAPNATGHGGEHRTYQIAQELAQLSGGDFKGIYGVRLHTPHRPRSPEPLILRVRSRLARMAGLPNWRRSDPPTNPPIKRHGGLLEPAEYTHQAELLTALSGVGPVTVLLEHPGFANSITSVPAATRANFICLPQNLETLDAIVPDGRRHSEVLREASVVNEIEALSKFNRRLVISQVEAALLNTVGLNADVYPYRPVNELRKLGMQLRSGRKPERGRFVLLGSASHHTTREGMEWLVSAILDDELPSEVRIDVIGSGTEKLLAELAPNHPNLRAAGFVSDEELIQFLSIATCVLAPQFRGMGSLTKLSELSLAGIPCLTGKHATFALDLPPGILGLPQRWDCWRAFLAGDRVTCSAELCEYENWEARQETLGTLLGRTASCTNVDETTRKFVT